MMLFAARSAIKGLYVNTGIVLFLLLCTVLGAKVCKPNIDYIVIISKSINFLFQIIFIGFVASINFFSSAFKFLPFNDKLILANTLVSLSAPPSFEDSSREGFDSGVFG